MVVRHEERGEIKIRGGKSDCATMVLNQASGIREQSAKVRPVKLHKCNACKASVIMQYAISEKDSQNSSEIRSQFTI
ncbi:hypothetical protein FACS1894219_06090 [Clostridia bacterium]|nr:hypothetical protein FACS1894219_06090 [Clostridia bacterium]